MLTQRPTVQHGLTDPQALLLQRHERGLRRLAGTLGARNGKRPCDVMFVLADRKGRIGNALSAALPAASIGPVVVPGQAAELGAWVERLALHGPVWDFSARSTGIPVIVVDEHDVMAVVRLRQERS